jgi:hypothetical protein
VLGVGEGRGVGGLGIAVLGGGGWGADHGGQQVVRSLMGGAAQPRDGARWQRKEQGSKP